MHERDTPKVDDWMGLMHKCNHRAISYGTNRKKDTFVFSCLENFAVLQMPEETIFQQYGAPSHYHIDDRYFLNKQFVG